MLDDAQDGSIQDHSVRRSSGARLTGPWLQMAQWTAD